MKVLIIAPLPPPMSGNALPAKVLLDELMVDNDVDVVNLSKKSHNIGITSYGRIMEVLKIFYNIWTKRKGKDVIYLTVAESLHGNIRDIIIYIICIRYLGKMVIHMLGGAVFIKEKSKYRLALNKYFLRRVGAIIVEGQAQSDIFAQIVPESKIHIVPNFSEDYLFLTEDEVSEKFNDIEPIRVLFLSNLLHGKGYNELAQAYLALSDEMKGKIVIDFAGKAETEVEAEAFMNTLKKASNLYYHGSVSGLDKKRLYAASHVFCLPTYYPYEGQPFCILEAYSAGCAVITTNHSGIGHVFKDGVNGYEVQKKCVESLSAMLVAIVERKESLRSIAMMNLGMAKSKYTKNIYLSSVLKILGKISKM